MDAAVDAARWIVGKALAPVIDGLLESWAASAGLGPNIGALKMQLLYAQGILDSAQGKDIQSAALKELLQKLRQLAYGADDVLDELDYFRIQDALDGTYDAANVEDQGCIGGLLLNARHTARSASNKLKPSCLRDASRGDPDAQEHGDKGGCLSLLRSSGGREIRSPSVPTNRGVQKVAGGCMPKVVSCARGTAHTIGKHLLCYFPLSVQDDDADTDMFQTSNMAGRRFLHGTCPSKARNKNNMMQTAKLQYNRVKMSEKMMEIVEQLKPLCAMVSTILDKELLGSAILKLDILGSNRTPKQDAGMSRSKTTPQIIEPELYGRDDQKKNIIDGITNGKYCTNELTVIPLVGPGGIGKTTLTQHIYRALESSFQVSGWICVSPDFNADRLVQEIVKKIPKVNGEKDNSSNEELIEQRLKSKRLLLVLDDVWTYREDEWKKLLAPLRYNGGEKGHVIIVTTRIPKVASMVTTSNSSIDVERLGREDIMAFFEVCVFGYQKPWEDHPKLRDVGSKIVEHLKGFPLVAKTVGRLLRNQLTQDHWTRVAESKEWELETGPNDIMPALKLSYDYLPFHLQQCFFHCGLFPEDYEFNSKDLVHFWIGLDIVHSRDQGKRTEDVALCYLNELVDHGFFRRNEKENGNNYVIHDLLHDLAVKVSSFECLSICSSNVRSISIPPSVRHLSIIVDNTDVMDLIRFEDYKSYLSALDKRLKVQNLRTLMLFGEYHGSFAKTFKGLFREARALRAIFLSEASYSVDDVLLNFSELVHLRYLRIKSVHNENICLPGALFRSYHLELIDLENWFGSLGSASQMSKLIKLRHFLVPDNYAEEAHSSIFEVGKLKFLQELRKFEVGKETKGFELSQLGELSELGGSLGIHNLEKVQEEDEPNVLKLIHKYHLRKLTLEWNNSRLNRDAKHEDNVLESIVPHKNLQDLCIRGHKGANCPSWLGGYLSVENLESLSLCDVSWNKLPPLGYMWFIDGLGVERQGLISTLSFQCLKWLELVKIPRLTKWVGKGTCHLFSLLEVVIIEHCPELTELPFSQPTCGQKRQEENMTWFPKLRWLKIVDCPKLLSLPPIPWTHRPCSAIIEGAGSCFKKLVYSKNYKSKLSLEIEGKDEQSRLVWNGLAFDNLADLKELKMIKCPPLPLIHLRKLRSLDTLQIKSMSNELLLFEGESCNTECPLPVERLEINNCANGNELTHMLSHFPKLTKLEITHCQMITWLGVVEHQAVETPKPALYSANEIEHAEAGRCQQQTRREENEVAPGGGGPLLLPRQLQELIIRRCRQLRLVYSSLDKDNKRGGLQHLYFLRSLVVADCPDFFFSYLSSASASSCFPFPDSLQQLRLKNMGRMEMLPPLANLISLTDLSLFDCGDLIGEGLWPLVAQGNLRKLYISGVPKLLTGSQPLWPHDQELPTSSSKLESLWTDDLAGLLTLPICRLLSSSITKLYIAGGEAQRFTGEQEEAFHLLSSLQELQFGRCEKLRHLPAGLTKFKRLKALHIKLCKSIRSLPKDGFPSCLQVLVIAECPAIKSLPRVCLPSSLRELHVYGRNSEELQRQCRNLKGTIPIMKDYV